MKEIRDINILAIESSCDETAAAVIHNGREVRSNVISSRLNCTNCTEALCLRLHPESILKRSTR